MSHRKIVRFEVQQVPNEAWSQCHFWYFALCDDGTAWEMRDADTMWRQVPIPGATESVEGLPQADNSASQPCSNEECPANWVVGGCSSTKYHECRYRDSTAGG
jgi:hypothetical protein